jgi:hypothetical protein
MSCAQGHNSAVLGVSWAYDESILATSGACASVLRVAEISRHGADADGIVMLWRREQQSE